MRPDVPESRHDVASRFFSDAGKNRTSPRLVRDWKAGAGTCGSISSVSSLARGGPGNRMGGEPDLPRLALILSPRSLKSGGSRNEISFAFDLSQDPHPRALSRPLGETQNQPAPGTLKTNVGKTDTTLAHLEPGDAEDAVRRAGRKHREGGGSIEFASR